MMRGPIQVSGGLTAAPRQHAVIAWIVPRLTGHGWAAVPCSLPPFVQMGANRSRASMCAALLDCVVFLVCHDFLRVGLRIPWRDVGRVARTANHIKPPCAGVRCLSPAELIEPRPNCHPSAQRITDQPHGKTGWREEAGGYLVHGPLIALLSSHELLQASMQCVAQAGRSFLAAIARPCQMPQRMGAHDSCLSCRTAEPVAASTRTRPSMHERVPRTVALEGAIEPSAGHRVIEQCPVCVSVRRVSV